MAHDAHRLYLQIVNGTGALVKLPGGEVLERDLVTEISAAILARCSITIWEALASGVQEDVVDHVVRDLSAKRIGLLASKQTVIDHARESLRERLDEAQRAQRVSCSMPTYVTEAEVRAAIEQGIRTAVQALKDQTRYAVGPM